MKEVFIPESCFKYNPGIPRFGDVYNYVYLYGGTPVDASTVRKSFFDALFLNEMTWNLLMEDHGRPEKCCDLTPPFSDSFGNTFDLLMEENPGTYSP